MPASAPHARARGLRRDQTDAEALLWSRLRAGSLDGAKFRRQFPIGNFIADFCCRKQGLVIELDGSQHMEPRRRISDEKRSQLMAARGYRVLRFWDTEVLTNLDGVLEAIFEALRQPSPGERFADANARRPLPGQGEVQNKTAGECARG